MGLIRLSLSELDVLIQAVIYSEFHCMVSFRMGLTALQREYISFLVVRTIFNFIF